MDEHIIKTPATHPDHPVVGHYFAGYHYGRERSEIYLCDSFDSRVDYFMTNVNDPADRRDVSVRAIGRTWREAFDCGDFWRIPEWSERIQKADIQLAAGVAAV